MANYLLDSNAFFTFKTDPLALRREARQAIESPQNQIFVSVACLWELAIKAANGKLARFAAMIAPSSDSLLESLRESRLELLPIGVSHALRAAALPQHHRDPFDRMMIAQALEEKLALISSDAAFSRYAGLQILSA
jgi:PIN domain nuclease of toxin-antitoxin system